MIIVRANPLYSGRDGFVQCKSDPWVYSKRQFKMGGDHLPDWADGGMRIISTIKLVQLQVLSYSKIKLLE